MHRERALARCQQPTYAAYITAYEPRSECCRCLNGCCACCVASSRSDLCCCKSTDSLAVVDAELADWSPSSCVGCTVTCTHMHCVITQAVAVIMQLHDCQHEWGRGLQSDQSGSSSCWLPVLYTGVSQPCTPSPRFRTPPSFLFADECSDRKEKKRPCREAS